MAAKGEFYRHKAITDAVYVVDRVSGDSVSLKGKDRSDKVTITLAQLKQHYVKVG